MYTPCCDSEKANTTSEGESSDSDSNRSSARGRRVSLGSLCPNSPQDIRATPRVPESNDMSALAQLPSFDGQAETEIVPTGVDDERSLWFQVGFIPENKAELLSWHPNRVRATVVAELHRRVEHMKPRRSKAKTFEPLIALRNIYRPPCGETKYTKQMRRDDGGHNTSRDLYFRVLNIITAVPIRSVRVSHAKKWRDTSAADKAEWMLLARIIKHPRIAPVIDFPQIDRFRKRTETGTFCMGPEAKGDEKNMEFQGYAFTLTYNTDLGCGEADVIKLIQCGKTGESLYKGLRQMPIYSDAFGELWDHANKLARSKKFKTVNISMEHSMNGDWDGRVHFHVFLGPDLRSGIGFAWNPELKTVKSDELVWKGKKPNVKCTRPQKRSWNQIFQAAVSGAYYVAGPKIGCILKRSTHRPIEDTI